MPLGFAFGNTLSLFLLFNAGFEAGMRLILHDEVLWLKSFTRM